MRALITRPLEDAKPLAEYLQQRGIEPVLAPLISIAPLQTPLPDLSTAQALLFTSANGVRSFARLSAERGCRALTVGNATAETARAFGFSQVFSASGNAVSLVAMACRLLDPKAGGLYHITGQTHAGDLAADLGERGFTVTRLELYRAQAAESLPAEVAAGFRQNKLELALFYSPHTAEIFTRLIAAADLTSHMVSVTALCLSQAVADAADLPFAAKKIAERPDQESLLNLLPALNKSKTPPAPLAPEKPDAPLDPGAARAKPVKAAANLAARGSRTSAVIGGSIGGSIGAGLIVIAAIASAPLWLEHLPLDSTDIAIAARIDTLERDQAAIVQRLETASANSLDIADPAPRLEALERELAALRNRLAAPIAASAELPVEWRRRLDKLEQAMRNAADVNGLTAINERAGRLSQAMAQFEERLSHAEHGIERSGERVARQAAFAIAAAHLADVTRSNQPFPALLASLRALARNDGDILALLEPLNGAAFHGVARQADIVLAFSDAARKAKAADLAEGSGGWLAEIRRFLGALITIRRTTVEDGASDIDRRLAQAASRLDSGDLAAALETLEDLPQQASLTIDPWRQQARQRVELDRAVHAITERALAALAKSGS